MTYGFGATFKATLAAALVLGAVTTGVDAKPGVGGSMGSRGSQTFSAPPPTSTAPRTAQPMQRTETPSVAPRPGMATPAPAQPRRFGFGTGLMAGLLGAGLIGLFTGHGLFGGLEGLMSMFGLLVQVGLIVGVIWFAVRFFRRRSEPSLVTAGGPSFRSGLGPVPGGASAGGPGGTVRQVVQIEPQDYQAFEHLLGEIQIAYGRGDTNTLRQATTPEMARYLEQDLASDHARGVRNEVSQPRLLQGDLSEAWREGTAEYATVAMRFEVIDAYREVASGRVVSGDPAKPSEATEIWTFRRDMRAAWLLSAIQQTA